MFQKKIPICTLYLTLLSISTFSFSQRYIEPAMKNIPAGSFHMGTTVGADSAKPYHLVQLPAFQMAKYPVTVAEFRKFVAATGFNPKATCKDH